MDIRIAKKQAPLIKKYRLLVLTALIVAIAVSVNYLWILGQSDFSVDRATLVFDDVKRGDFSVSVRGSGLLVPDNIQWLAANVEATVVNLAVKAGNIVKKGDLIVELSSPQLVQQLAEAQWELEAQQAEAKASKVAQELQLLEQQASVLNAKLNYESSLLKNNAETELVNQSTGAVSKLDYQRTQLETGQFRQRWQISQQQLTKMQENVIAQNAAQNARLGKTQKRLERIQQLVDELQVKATMNSIVLDMPLALGQRTTIGTNIAKLAQQGSLIAQLQVPEIQIRDVAIGQRVIIDTRNNKIEGLVARIEPGVINGNVQVDVAFTSRLSSDARPDLSVDGEIKISEIADTLFVDRPLFIQSQSQSALYKLTSDGQFAERVEVTVGYGSIHQIQILNGLAIGDKIVTSDPSQFERYQKIRIN